MRRGFSRCGVRIFPAFAVVFSFRRPHAFLLSFRFPSSERRKTAVFAARFLNFRLFFFVPLYSAPLPVAHGVRFPREFPYRQGSVCALPIFVFPHFFRFLSIVQNPRLLRIPYSAIASLFFVYSNFPRLSHSYNIVLFPAKSPRRPCPVRFPPFKFLRCPSHKISPAFPRSPAAVNRRRFFPYIQMSFLSQNATPSAPNAAKNRKERPAFGRPLFSISVFMRCSQPCLFAFRFSLTIPTAKSARATRKETSQTTNTIFTFK